MVKFLTCTEEATEKLTFPKQTLDNNNNNNNNSYHLRGIYYVTDILKHSLIY